MTAPGTIQLSEEEILVRAREAVIAEPDEDGDLFLDQYIARYRQGEFDAEWTVRIAARALRDLSKPLSEIKPVDPDLVEAEKVLLELQADPEIGPYLGLVAIHTALKRGKELAQQVSK